MTLQKPEGEEFEAMIAKLDIELPMNKLWIREQLTKYLSLGLFLDEAYAAINNYVNRSSMVDLLTTNATYSALEALSYRTGMNVSDAAALIVECCASGQTFDEAIRELEEQNGKDKVTGQ